MQSDPTGFFGVELCGDDVFEADDGGEIDAGITGCADYACLI